MTQRQRIVIHLRFKSASKYQIRLQHLSSTNIEAAVTTSTQVILDFGSSISSGLVRPSGTRVSYTHKKEPNFVKDDKYYLTVVAKDTNDNQR